jgi:hypothetical protein
MPNAYTPVAEPLPATITEPVDGEDRTTASVTQITRPIANAVKNSEALITTMEVDLAAALADIRLGMALTFPSEVESALILTHGKYHVPSREWLACSQYAADTFVFTKDPYLWPGASDIDGAGISTLRMYDFDVTPDGHVVGASSADDTTGMIWRFNRTSNPLANVAGVWHSNIAIGDNIYDPSLVFEPVSQLWCIAFSSKGAGVPPTDIAFWTAPEATFSGAAVGTWTSRTKPLGMPTDAEVMLATDGLGAIVAVGCSPTSPAFLYHAKSTDGGVTWSAALTELLGFDQLYTFKARPHVLWTGTKWVLIASNYSTTRTRVYQSTNGTSWTLVANLTSAAIASAANIGGVLVGIGHRGSTLRATFVSSDAGATWQWGTRKFTSDLLFVAASPTQYLVSEGTLVHPSVARGPGNLLVT